MSTEQKNEHCKTYHHGNLRNALIIAAAELIEENGSVDFAMIDAARRAGVSSAAPYRHFKDKDALLEAVTALAFMGLTDTSRQTVASLPAGSTERLVALGKSYIRFVTGHPEFYDLMWGDMGLRAVHAEKSDLRTSGFYILVESVQQWCEANLEGSYDTLELAVRLWAIAHGLACLAMNRHIEEFIPDADVYALLEGSTHIFLDGVRQDS